MSLHECGPWSFIQQYDVVCMLWLNESDLQGIEVMFDVRSMEIWLETAVGAIRRTVVLNICQGRCCWSRDHSRVDDPSSSSGALLRYCESNHHNVVLVNDTQCPSATYRGGSVVASVGSTAATVRWTFSSTVSTPRTNTSLDFGGLGGLPAGSSRRGPEQENV